MRILIGLPQVHITLKRSGHPPKSHVEKLKIPPQHQQFLDSQCLLPEHDALRHRYGVFMRRLRGVSAIEKVLKHPCVMQTRRAQSEERDPTIIKDAT